MNLFYLISPWVLQTLIWVPTRFCLWFFGRMNVSGIENLKDVRRGVIFAANHTSELDSIVIPAALPFFNHLMPMFYTSREKSFYKNSGWRQHFYGGLFFKIWGAHPVLVGLHDYAKSLATHISIIRYGGSVIIFPEGRTSKAGELLKAKGGVAYLAHTAHAPIIPVTLIGLSGMNIKKFFLRKARIGVIFGKPLLVTDISPVGEAMIVSLERDTYIEAAERVMTVIRQKLPAPSLKPVAIPIPQESIPTR